MASRKKSETESGGEGDGVRHVGNGFDPTVVASYTERIERLLDDLASEKGSYMERCKSIRQDIAFVVQEAKDQSGIPKKEFKAVIKTRELEEKLERIREDLEGVEQETFDQIRHALGDLADLPLGGAALAKATDRPQTQV